MDKAPDDVSNIHNRFSLTLINPSTHYFSLFVSLGVAVITTLAIYFGYFYSSIEDFWFRIPLVVTVLFLTQLLDTRFTKKHEYSKSLHSSLFGNMLWTATVLVGIAGCLILSKEVMPFFIAFGVFLFASFRIGIYTTTLGVNLKKAWAICFVQPIAMYLALIPQEMWVEQIFDTNVLFYGISFMAIASVWSFMTDRAGRPGMYSTHKTIQAYLASQGNDHTEAEEIMEQRSSGTKVSTSQIKLTTDKGNNEFRKIGRAHV